MKTLKEMPIFQAWAVSAFAKIDYKTLINQT